MKFAVVLLSLAIFSTVGSQFVSNGKSVEPTARFKYVLDTNSSTVTQYRVNADGTRTKLVPATVAAHSHPTAIAFHPSGQFAYVSCSHGALCQYRIKADGQLAPLSPPAIYTRHDPSVLQFEAGGRFAAVSAGLKYDESGKALNRIVFRYRVQADGTLREIGRRTINHPITANHA